MEVQGQIGRVISQASRMFAGGLVMVIHRRHTEGSSMDVLLRYDKTLPWKSIASLHGREMSPNHTQLLGL